MIVVVMSISMIFDVSEKLNYFMDPENDLTVFKILVDYYPYFFINYWIRVENNFLFSKGFVYS